MPWITEKLEPFQDLIDGLKLSFTNNVSRRYVSGGFTCSEKGDCLSVREWHLATELFCCWFEDQLGYGVDKYGIEIRSGEIMLNEKKISLGRGSFGSLSRERFDGLITRIYQKGEKLTKGELRISRDIKIAEFEAMIISPLNVKDS